ncbi:hypothetical protein CEXT_567271 [Caerostris extrusa]|uniref:Uncharacterized protein n=1 Tax=Caerostris extrusa TaxID=172846 RepID=A0AAV4V6N4_CAEEX|nr:hypothetical protein CEXT_567271 [Caerostris extrusa]
MLIDLAQYFGPTVERALSPVHSEAPVRSEPRLGNWERVDLEPNVERSLGFEDHPCGHLSWPDREYQDTPVKSGYRTALEYNRATVVSCVSH